MHNVSAPFFRRVVVPVANPDDAAATMAALVPYIEVDDATVIAVNVIEKAGGAPDKASVEQRELYAEDIFSVVTRELADSDVDLETRILYGTNIAAAIVDAAHEVGASAIVFTPRGGSRWVKLLTGDVTGTLVTESDIPVVVLPDLGGSDE